MSIEVEPEAQTAGHRVNGENASSLPPSQPETRTRWKHGLLIVAVLAVVAAIAAVVLRSATPKDDRRVLTHAIARGDLVVSVTDEGALESSSNKEIKCKVKGGSTVLWVVETGTEVKPGDELVRLDTSTIEDNISAQKIVYENALANKITAEADVAVAKIGITEYIEGTYKSELTTKEKELVIAESDLKTAKNALAHAQKMFRRSYISKLELDTKLDGVKHAKLEVKVKETDLEVLAKYTRAKTLKELESLFEVAQARLAADTAALELEKARLIREKEQLENCVIKAENSGMVIYPSAAAWKEQPDIEEGATVREDQVLLVIPDLRKMQVKVGIHESKVDLVKPGNEAQIQLQSDVISGNVVKVASITRPSGWWNGNLVEYDTVIEVTEHRAVLKPGMSVAVEIFLARHNDVLTVPVAAVLEQNDEFVCWVETGAGIVKRSLELGDSNDQFIVVERGLEEGEQVVLNPLDFLDEAQTEALKPIDAIKRSKTGTEEGVEGGDEKQSPAKNRLDTEKRPNKKADLDTALKPKAAAKK